MKYTSGFCKTCSKYRCSTNHQADTLMAQAMERFRDDVAKGKYPKYIICSRGK